MCEFVCDSACRWIVVSFLVICLACQSNQVTQTCGRLYGVSHGTSRTCVLEPSSIVESSAKVVIRWYKDQVGIDKARNTFNLTIHRDSTFDYGVYRVDCFEFVNNKYGDVMTASTTCTVNATLFKNEENTEIATTPSGPQLGSSLVIPVTATTPLNGTVISVVAICLVIITVIIAGTVLLVKKKRVSMANAGGRLVKDEGARSGPCVAEDSSSIYNEIDINADDYARIDGSAVIKDSRKKTVGRSPSLPKRPENNVKLSESDNTVADTGGACAKDAKNNYNKDIDKPGDIVVYAKVNKRKTLSSKDEQRKSRKLNEGGGRCRGSMLLPHHDDMSGPTYNNIANQVSRQHSSKATESAAGNELQYAELAHVEADDPERGTSCGADDGAGGIGALKCQYASIDFEQKAFVAPIRKAPSSWYKWKNRKKEKSKCDK
ncbi:hypothetical protein MAR_020982 [Mya arenaria]|uniref:Uncharacterized protein n=1 Tax=Mya arenaria TaxID=6604 RepID=A0ABY7E6E0_MYAAR|nr:uncharacterized protein LOC128233868 [Mya arenaria]WAR05613.1 hypothetical protein MAR_020982 [Mya arenaria]